MFALLLIFFALILFTALIYSPAIYHYCVYRYFESKFVSQLKEWEDNVKNNLIVVERKLGEGISQNSDIRFSEAHNNMSFAVNSIMETVADSNEV